MAPKAPFSAGMVVTVAVPDPSTTHQQGKHHKNLELLKLKKTV